MRISDWSSDVCSSDLRDRLLAAVRHVGDVHAVPEHVVQAVDLYDRGAKVGQQLRAEWPCDREAEIEHGDAFERRLDPLDRKSTRLNSSHSCASRMPSSA